MLYSAVQKTIDIVSLLILTVLQKKVCRRYAYNRHVKKKELT